MKHHKVQIGDLVEHATNKDLGVGIVLKVDSMYCSVHWPKAAMTGFVIAKGLCLVSS